MSLQEELDARISVLDHAGWEDITRRVSGLVEWMKGQSQIEAILGQLRSGPVYSRLHVLHPGRQSEVVELATTPENIAAIGLAMMERCIKPPDRPVHLHQIAHSFGIGATVNHPAPHIYQFEAALKRYIQPCLRYVRQGLLADQRIAQAVASPTTSTEFHFDVFLSHSSKDKSVVRPLAERLRADGLRVWFDEWVLKPGDSIPAKIDEGLEQSRVLVLCMSANAFGSDWALLESHTIRFRDPLNKTRRFIPLRLDDAHIKGSLAQFLYINWSSEARDQEYVKLLEACKSWVAAQCVVKETARFESHETPLSRFDQSQGPALRANEKLEISPQDLCDRLKSIPPLQVDEAKKPYLGFWVDWLTTLTSAYKHLTNSELCVLRLNPIPAKNERGCSLIWIHCVVRLPDFPPLKIVPQDGHIRVFGQITDLTSSGVTLTNVKLEFPSNPV
jgi:hypothetical protein